MATGASNADAIVLLLDVEKGLLPQTRRHVLIARLLGIRQAVAFVNKMDGGGDARGVFEKCCAELKGFGAPLGFESLDLLPGSALGGDMVVHRRDALDWYKGPTLLERLETLRAGAEQAAGGPFRFPVQLVSKPSGSSPRGYMGRIESGHVLARTEVSILPSRRRSRVRHIVLHGAEREIAVAGDSVMLVLADDIDIGRGDLIAGASTPPREARSLDVTLVWLGHQPVPVGARYLVQQAARRTLARISQVHSRMDIDTLGEIAVEGRIGANDIVRARLSLQAPLFVDSYDEVRATGALILIDEATNHTVAAGLVQ